MTKAGGAGNSIDKKDWPIGLARSLKLAKRERKALLSDAAESLSSKAAVKRVEACRQEARCRHVECPVCNYLSEVARRQLFQSADATCFVGRSGVHLSLDALRVMPNRRPIDPAKVQKLQWSMCAIGQLYPIIVRERKGRHYIVVGLHRYEAAKALGWGAIWCTHTMGDADETETRLILVSENLHRADLRVLDWAEYVEEWRLLVSQRLKEGQTASPLMTGSPAPGGIQPRDTGVKKTAKALGFSPREVGRARLIASLSADAKEIARSVKLDNHKAVLTEVAALPNGVQSDAIRAIAARRASEAKTPELLAAKLARAEEARLEAAIVRDEDRLEKLNDAIVKNKKLLVQLSAVNVPGQDGATVLVRGPSSQPNEEPAVSPPTSQERIGGFEVANPVIASDVDLLRELVERFNQMSEGGRQILTEFLPRYESAPMGVREEFFAETRIARLR